MTANFLVAAMAIQCAIAACIYAYQAQYPFALMFAGYTVANLGIIWAANA